MKKFTLMMVALVFAGAASAQDMTSKRGINILPEAGDFSLSVSANPFLDYVGKFVGSTAGSSSSNARFDFLNGWQMVQGRYFMSETMAIRGGLRIGFGSNTESNYVTNAVNNNVEEKDEESGYNVFLSGGVEFRRGNYGRFQGYYGGEVVLGIQGSKTINQTASTTVAGVNEVETKEGTTLTVGANAFVGVEYFFAPKVAIGGELGWGLFLSSTGDGEITTTPAGGTSTTVDTGGSTTFGVDTNTGYTSFGTANGNLKLSFFF
ncbi:MAG: hypothetical protein LW884_02070 [Bacteroidetes bacterium]|nr:hypothetical protein [Bacteroidota bacterium]